MKTLKIQLALGLLIALTSCEKISYKDTTITGQAINLTDGSALVGYPINLVETEMSPMPFGPVSQTVVASTETDALGKFVFQEELSKRNRYEYHVVFGDRGEAFFDNTWQEGSYEAVTSKVKVDVGTFQTAEIKQIPAASTRVRIDNQSSDTIMVEGIMANDFHGGIKAYALVLPNTIHGTNQYTGFMAGAVTMTWYVGIQGDTFIFEDNYVLPHNKDTTLRFTYPRN